MKSILLVTPKWQDIKAYLERNMTSVYITGCNDVYELYEKASKTFIRQDIILIKDDAFTDTASQVNNNRKAGGLLYSILKQDYLEVQRVIFLSQLNNPLPRETMEDIRNSNEINTKIEIEVSDGFQIRQVLNLLLANAVKFDKQDPKYRYVIKAPRHQQIGDTVIPVSDSDKAMVVYYKEANMDIDLIKKQTLELYREDLEQTPPPPSDSLPDISLEESIDLSLNSYNLSQESRPQVTLLTGESKSGVSTTTLILGATSASTQKTLIIDMNWTNLGLSYLVETTLIPEQINNISFDYFINSPRKIEDFKDAVFHRHNLHVLTLRLPLKQEISKSTFAFMVQNILSYAKKFYNNIYIDAPLYDISDYQSIIPYVDKMLVCTPPYANNIISTLTELSKTDITHFKLFNNVDNNNTLNDITLFRTGVFAVTNKNIKPMSTATINKYAQRFLSKNLKSTATYLYSGQSYIDKHLLSQIDNKQSKGVDSEEPIPTIE